MLFRTPQLFYTIFIFTLNYVTNNMFYVTGGRSLDITSENFQIFRLAEAYRKHGHKKATLDPLGLQQRT